KLAQGDAHLVLILLGLRFDGDANNRFGERDRLEHDRLRLVAQRVAGDRALGPHYRRDLARFDLGDVLALVGVELDEPAHPLALVTRRVVGIRTGLERARVHPHKGQLAHEGIGHDLEGKRAEGLAWIGAAYFFGIVARIDARDWRN